MEHRHLIPTMMRHVMTIAALGACVLATACTDARAAALSGLRGVQLSPSRPKPHFTLQSTTGRPFDFAAATAGKVTLLYFGYTNCPDVCPVQMHDIASAMRQLTPEQQAQIRVVFVTTDPARDTLPRLEAWLANFNPGFIGLRASIDTVNAIAAALGQPPADIEPMNDSVPGPHPMQYAVGHGAAVLAFTPDDSLRVEYPGGFGVPDWVNDLPRLMKIK